ncbi:MAG: ATP-binding cassette domain-containing protein [Dehalococcoidia bacterium]
MQAISTKELTKLFGDLIAVDHVTLEIAEGEIFGLLGPNGAGKTTLAKMLSTLLVPTSGFAELWGYDIASKQDEVRRCIGVVFQDPSIDDKLTGRENLDFHARMYGLEKGIREKRINELLDLVDLQGKADIQVEAYSGGMQRRLEIARGLMHRPNVLFLDEPTLGLDVQTRRHIWEYIRRLNQQERITILLMTHYMEEADYLCDRIAIIDQGRIISLDTPENLKKLAGVDMVSIRTGDSVSDVSALFNTFEWVQWVKDEDGMVNIGLENGESRIPEIVMHAYGSGMTIKSINLHKPTLEDVFLKFTGKKIREEEGDRSQYFDRVMRTMTRRK